MTDSITTAAETGFAGADLEALRSYCTRLNIKFTKSHNAVTLRKMLEAAMAEGSDHFSETVVTDEQDIADQKRLEALNLTSLNLRAQAGWQGRRRIILLHRAMAHESTRPQFFAWGRLHCYIPLGIEVPVPYPIWHVLQDTAGKRMVRKRRVDDEGRVYFQEEWVPTQRFMYSDMGDDPKTAHLPTDMVDMVTRLYKLTDAFDGFSERQYKEICSRLFINVKPEWTAVDLKAEIEAKCQLSTGRVDLSAGDDLQAALG